MSSFLNYLDHYEEKENDVIFYLKDYPSSTFAGDTIVKELYMFFFPDEYIQLNRVHKIDELKYVVQKEQEYYCLNCETPLFFNDDSNYITTCEYCNWRNELNDTPAITPIVLKSKDLEDYIIQICYPLIEEKDLEALPDKLKEAVIIYFKKPEQFEKKHKDNIYHNLLKKDIVEFEKIRRKYENKAKLARFFQNTTFF